VKMDWLPLREIAAAPIGAATIVELTLGELEDPELVPEVTRRRGTKVHSQGFCILGHLGRQTHPGCGLSRKRDHQWRRPVGSVAASSWRAARSK
jgi:hypothetical protein